MRLGQDMQVETRNGCSFSRF